MIIEFYSRIKKYVAFESEFKYKQSLPILISVALLRFLILDLRSGEVLLYYIEQVTILIVIYRFLRSLYKISSTTLVVNSLSKEDKTLLEGEGSSQSDGSMGPIG